MKPPMPKVKAFLICDQTIRSTDGKYSIIGIFSRVHSTEFPVYHPRFGIYIMLGKMSGKYDFAVKFIDPLADQLELGKAELNGVEHKSPLDDLETGINLPGLQFPHAGTYEVHLIVNNELLHVITIQALEMKK